jgi:hypothetical protein
MHRVHSPQSPNFALQSPPRLHLGMTTPSNSTVLLSQKFFRAGCRGRKLSRPENLPFHSEQWVYDALKDPSFQSGLCSPVVKVGSPWVRCSNPSSDQILKIEILRFILEEHYKPDAVLLALRFSLYSSFLNSLENFQFNHVSTALVVKMPQLI